MSTRFLKTSSQGRGSVPTPPASPLSRVHLKSRPANRPGKHTPGRNTCPSEGARSRRGALRRVRERLPVAVSSLCPRAGLQGAPCQPAVGGPRPQRVSSHWCRSAPRGPCCLALPRHPKTTPLCAVLWVGFPQESGQLALGLAGGCGGGCMAGAEHHAVHSQPEAPETPTASRCAGCPAHVAPGLRSPAPH